jgi:hypothetical protein
MVGERLIGKTLRFDWDEARLWVVVAKEYESETEAARYRLVGSADPESYLRLDADLLENAIASGIATIVEVE